MRRSILALAASALALGACGSDDTSVADPTTTTTTTTTTAPTVDDLPAIWPPEDADRFATAEDAALDFAREFLGMPDASLAEPDDAAGATEDREDRVGIRPYEDRGPTTVVEVAPRDRGWVVTGATSDRIVVTEPTPDAPLASPLTVGGESTAFEGTIELEVRAIGSTEPIATGFATGGAQGAMAPFETTLDFDLDTGATHAVLVVFAPDASDMAVMLEATVLLVG